MTSEWMIKALESLLPNAQWALRGEMTYKQLEWADQQYEKPSEATLEAEATRLQTAWDYDDYRRKRAVEYPPATDYLDAVVKGDTTQIQQYIAACLAVKAKYQKPE